MSLAADVRGGGDGVFECVCGGEFAAVARAKAQKRTDF